MGGRARTKDGLSKALYLANIIGFGTSRRKKFGVSFNFTICHEGFYPFRDKLSWPLECKSDPSSFSPTIDGVLSTVEWKKFDFDEEETREIFSVAPALVVDKEEPLPKPTPPPPEDAAPPPMPISMGEEKKIEPAPAPERPHRLQDFWRGVMKMGDPPSPAPPPASTTNFTQISQEKFPDLKNVQEKPISISPPSYYESSPAFPLVAPV